MEIRNIEENKALEESLKQCYLKNQPKEIHEVAKANLDAIACKYGSCEGAEVIFKVPDAKAPLIRKLDSGLYLVEGVHVATIHEEESFLRELFGNQRQREKRFRAYLFRRSNARAYEQKFAPTALVIPLPELK